MKTWKTMLIAIATGALLLPRLTPPGWADELSDRDAFARRVQRVAPSMSLPGKILCVCQSSGHGARTGYVASFIQQLTSTTDGVMTVCAYDVYNHTTGDIAGSSFCELFEVIK